MQQLNSNETNTNKCLLITFRMIKVRTGLMKNEPSLLLLFEVLQHNNSLLITP